MKKDISKDGKLHLIAKTLYGLEEVLADEIRSIGGRNVLEGIRMVEYDGDWETLCKSNFHLRTATRVLVVIKSFKCRDEYDLYHEIQKINWAEYLDVKGSLAIDAVINKSNLDNTHYAAQKTKDAIVDQFRDKYNARPNVDLENPDLRINLHIHQNKATLSLDSSGQPLFRRGYRIEAGMAPLSEVLAAGIIYMTGWDRESPLVDPMCGSGTIPIEAALMAQNIAPGLIGRKYGFQKWPGGSYKPHFDKVRKEAEEAVIKRRVTDIIGSDKAQKAVDLARANAKRAGVSKYIEFGVSSIAKIKTGIDSGTTIMNPPYGERLPVGEKRRFYGMIGDSLKNNFEGFNSWVFTGNLEAPKQIGLRPKRKIKLYNSPLECRLLKYEIYQGSRKTKYQSDR